MVGYYTDHHHDDRYYAKDSTYTKAEVDAAVAAGVDAAVQAATEADTISSPAIIGVTDVVFNQEAWDLNLTWGHDCSGNGCIMFDTELPAGATIDSVDFTYSAPVAITDASVAVANTPNLPVTFTGNPSTTSFFNGASSFPATAPGTIGSTTILPGAIPPNVSSGPIGGAEFDPSLVLCTDAAMNWYGARIHFTVP